VRSLTAVERAALAVTALPLSIWLSMPALAQSDPTTFQRGDARWRALWISHYIEARMDNPIRVRELAQLVGLSPGHLSRSFHVRFGMTLRDYASYPDVQ
jgi:transcriptional regulator GlxA family with amidase domain